MPFTDLVIHHEHAAVWEIPIGTAPGTPVGPGLSIIEALEATLAAIAALNDLSAAQVTDAVPTVLQIQSGLATAAFIAAGFTALNQSASRRIVLASSVAFEVPSTGSIEYVVELRTFDGDGGAINATGTPTLTATGGISGDLSARLSAWSNVTTGLYRATLTVQSTDDSQQLRFDTSANLGDGTFTASFFASITDSVAQDFTAGDRVVLQAIADRATELRLSKLDATVSSRASQTAVDDVPTNGELATALSGADDAVLVAIAAEAVKTAAIQAVTVKLNTGLVLDGAVYQWTANSLELAPAGGGGGGSGDALQATLLEVQDTAQAIAAALAGAPVNPIGRVASGGRLVVYIGDDWRARSATAQTIPVSDPAGGLYTKLLAIGAANLQFGASRLNSAAGLITGSVVSVTQTTIDTVLHCLISVEMTAAGVGLQPADDYEYQISQRQTHSAEFDDFVEITGQLSLRARRVAIS